MRRTVLGLIFVLVISNIAIAQPAPQTWGLCIGISEYTPEALTLKWADKDAIEFSTFLRHKLNLPEDHYRILKNSEATRENILESLGWLSMSANEGDRVYIFYSGHGKNNSPILSYDSDNLLTPDTIKKALNKIDARDVVFFVDACYSGKLAGKGAKAAIERENLTGLSKGLIVAIAQAKIGTVIMTSANGIQEAYELDNQKNGIFTYHLMKVLMDHAQYRIADRDENGEVTLYEVYQYVHQAITPESQQEPQISDPEKAKQIVLFSFSLTIEDSIVEIAPEPSKGMSKTTKVALGVGSAAALGGGIALMAGGGGGGDSNNDEDSATYSILGLWDYEQRDLYENISGGGSLSFDGSATSGTYLRLDSVIAQTFQGTYTVDGISVSMSESSQEWTGGFESSEVMRGIWNHTVQSDIAGTWTAWKQY